MRLMHISDLHIGKLLHEVSMIDDQKYILNQIVDIAKKEGVYGVIIAGDVYDKNDPSEQAVKVFDEFLVNLQMNDLKIYLISGNHDSAKRLSYANRLLKYSGVYISSEYSGDAIVPIEVKDDNVSVNIYLMPFVTPLRVKSHFPDVSLESDDFTGAVELIIKQMNISKEETNIIVSHQYVNGAITSDSERQTAGGLDYVEPRVFEDFDYVALGHMHRPQYVNKSSKIRYSGTPLKYSKSECGDTKSISILDITGPKQISVSEVELKPLHDVRVKEAYFEEFLKPDVLFQNDETVYTDYLYVQLKDKEVIAKDASILRKIYKGFLDVDYVNIEDSNVTDTFCASSVEAKSEMDLFEELFKVQYEADFLDEQKEYLKGAIEKARLLVESRQDVEDEE
ncbi:MAG: exonuclease SbcCD subunit D [Clostridia bacterium]|nr:exonuclease SbcCD subunit D [Clostridia bacterium]